MWICLAILLIPGIWSVPICEDSIVLPSGSLVFIALSIIIGSIVWMACLARCIFSPEPAIAIMVVLVGLGGVSMWFIKLILGLLLLILLSIASNRYSRPFSMPPILFFKYASSWCPDFFAKQVLLPCVKLLPQIQHYNFLFGLAWLICAETSVLN